MQLVFFYGACVLFNISLPRVIRTLAAAAAQDPAPGWVAYARGLSPTGKGRITYIEGYCTSKEYRGYTLQSSMS